MNKVYSVDNKSLKFYNICMEKLILEEETLVEEQSTIFDKQLISPKNFDWVKDEVAVLIFHTPNDKFEICGKSMLEWVGLACAKMQTQILQEVGDENLLSTIREHSQDKNIVLVLYSDTPLLQQKTVLNILDYFCCKNMNALILPRGFVFKNEFLQNSNEVASPVRKSFAPEEFEQIANAEQISSAFEVLQSRIRKFHQHSGVILKGENTIFIDADVQIEKGVVIEPFNVIKGDSIIEGGVVLKSGNYIEGSLIKSGAVLLGKNVIGGKEI